VAGERVAGLRQLDRAGAALDQPLPDLALERGHVLAHRRLRERQRVGRGREGAVRGDLPEHPEPSHVDHQCHLYSFADCDCN
jgi:hypothetical protein